MKIRTTIHEEKLTKDNVYRLPDHNDYTNVVITTSFGTEKSIMTFPRHKSVSMNHPLTRRAIKTCVDSTRKHLLGYLSTKKRIAESE